MKDEMIPSREMTAPEQEAGIHELPKLDSARRQVQSWLGSAQRGCAATWRAMGALQR